MHKFKVYLLAAAGFVVLSAVLAVIGPRRVLAAVGYTPVRDVANPALQPVQFALQAGPSEPASWGQFTVPQGKRLVIEYVTASWWQGTLTVQLNTTVGGWENNWILADPPSSPTHVNCITTRIYADPGTQVSLYIGGPAGQGYVEVSGYYVNLP